MSVCRLRLPVAPEPARAIMKDRIEEARVAVLSASRRMSRLGLVVSVWGNVSARVRKSSFVVVTPSGVDYECLDPSMLCLIDMRSGAHVAGCLRPSSETKMHIAIYKARPDVGGVVHTHSLYASAFSVARKPIPPIVEDLAQVVGGAVECAKYAPAGSDHLARNVVARMGDRQAVLMANHGLVGVGDSPSEALRVCQLVEKAAQIHSVALALGRPQILAPSDVKRLHTGYKTSYGQKTLRLAGLLGTKSRS